MPALSAFVRRLIGSLVVIAVLAAIVTAHADDGAAVAEIEAYLNGIDAIEADFVQMSSNGGVAEGRLYLERPNRIRLDYAPPTPLQIYAEGFWLVFVDTHLQSVSHVPLRQTVAGLLVRDRLSLTEDVEVTRIERADGELRLHLVQKDEPDAGSVVLGFREDPLTLRHWTVHDPQGVETAVSLIAPKFNQPIDRSVFRFDPSRYGTQPFRYE